MGVCAQCEHFRRVRPASQLLATIYSTAHAEVSQALNKIVEDENKQRDEESSYKRSQVTAGKGIWAYRPMMSEYCGLHEEKEEYYIAEVRNAGMQCGDFRAGKPPRHACSDCTHRVRAEGAAKDQEREELYSKMIVKATGTKASTSQPEELLKSHRDGMASRKAFEASGVYSAKGRAPSKPMYADYCGLLSTPEEFVVCTLYNAHNTCSTWQAAAVQQAAPAPVPAPTGANVPPPPAAANTADVLAAGPPPLTRDFVQKFVRGLAWILDVTIPSQVEALVQNALVGDWTNKEGQAIAEAQQFVTMGEQVSAMTVENRDALREEHQAEFVAGLRLQTDPAAVALIHLYDQANAPIAMGNPPLTREIANCYFDLMALIQALQAGTEWQPLPDHVKASYTQVLAMQYPALDPSLQAWFSTLPRGWTALRAAWKNVPPAGREQMRHQILSAVGAPPVMPMAPAPFAPPQAQVPGYQMPGAFANQMPGPFANTPVTSPAPPQEGQTTDSLLSEILADDKAEEERLAKEDPTLALQARLANQARNAQMLSNMMQMRHDSMMSIVRNIR